MKNIPTSIKYWAPFVLFVPSVGGRDTVTGHGLSRVVTPGHGESRPFLEKKDCLFFVSYPKNLVHQTHYPDGGDAVAVRKGFPLKNIDKCKQIGHYRRIGEGK
jgi:hypothetical protein